MVRAGHHDPVPELPLSPAVDGRAAAGGRRRRGDPAGDRCATAPAPEPLPYADATFDFVTLGAILQLTPEAFDWYLAEAARVIRPGGTYFGTWFLWNDSRPDEDRPAGSRTGVAPAIACTEDEARRRLRSLGLTVDAVHRGAWDGYEPSLSHQDLVIARKAE